MQPAMQVPVTSEWQAAVSWLHVLAEVVSIVGHQVLGSSLCRFASLPELT